MTIFAKFRKLDMDTAAIGLTAVPTGFRSPYSCTPIGAMVFGAAGVDGIHFCRIRGLGETIFAVSPANAANDCVHPVAENFEVFLRLLIACGGTAPLEQAHLWDASGFRHFLSENPPSAEGSSILESISSALDLQPMEQPYEYIRQLQTNFDYSLLRFKKAHRQATPPAPEPTEWRVFFDGSLYGGRSGRRPGKELRIGRIFHWGSETWHIPAVYLCSGGVVTDFCAQADRQAVEAFCAKWLPRIKDGLTEAEEAAMLLENPLQSDIRPLLTVNGKTLRMKHGSSCFWSPTLTAAEPAAESKYARRVLEHYGLDLSENWVIHRISFPWDGRKPALRSMELTMAAEHTELRGVRFAAADGCTVPFHHPVTGTEHRLIVLETEAIDVAVPRQEDADYPTHCTAVEYAVFPDMEQNAVFLRDCCSGDPPRSRNGEQSIGGVFGVIRSPKSDSKVTSPHSSTPLLRRNACSSLYFQPPETVEWQICFRVKLREDTTVSLIP